LDERDFAKSADTTEEKEADQQDRQALLKAKYCPQVAAALCTHTHTQKHKTHVTLEYDLEIQ